MKNYKVLEVSLETIFNRYLDVHKEIVLDDPDHYCFPSSQEITRFAKGDELYIRNLFRGGETMNLLPMNIFNQIETAGDDIVFLIRVKLRDGKYMTIDDTDI